MLNLPQLYNDIAASWDQDILPSLSHYITIPNKSPHFDEKWQEHGYMQQAIEHVAAWCRAFPAIGMQLEILQLPNRTPLIFIEIPGQSDKTVLLYGHLDKQPEMTGWEADLGPWQPVMREGKLYGRGSADDGYAIYAALTAIRHLQQQDQGHARCVIIIEACEESGSYDLPAYIDILQDKIGQPELVICLDSGAGNYEQLWLTTSLRGNLVGELSVELLQEGVHSGAASGMVADSFRVARQLLSRIENEVTGKILLSACYCEIPAERIDQARACAEILQQSVYSEFPWHMGVKPVEQSLLELLLNRSWRPALTITGAAGLPELANAGNVMRPKTVLKLSMRLPPLACPKKAAHALSHCLTQDPPYQANVHFHLIDEAAGWNAPAMAPWLTHAVDDASWHFFQKPAAYLGEGGTIPFMAMLGKKFPQAQFMITGVLGPHSNAHGPNEFLHLEMAKKLTASVAYVLHQHFLQTSLDKL